MNDAAPESHWKFSQILVENIMSHRKPSWTYYYPRERDATIGFPKSSKRCRATVLLLILCCTMYTKGDNCLCSSGPQITTTPHYYYYCRSTRAAATASWLYPDENWEARHQKQRSYSSQLYTWLRHFSRQPEFELRGILLMIYYILRF